MKKTRGQKSRATVPLRSKKLEALLMQNINLESLAQMCDMYLLTVFWDFTNFIVVEDCVFIAKINMITFCGKDYVVCFAHINRYFVSSKPMSKLGKFSIDKVK